MYETEYLQPLKLFFTNFLTSIAGIEIMNESFTDQTNKLIF